MSTILPDLLQAFADHRLTIRAEAGEARSNDPDAQFARAFRADGTRLRGGAGLAFGELLLLEHLLADVAGRCLIIGNGFGWSGVALAMLLRGRGQVVAIDACVDGDEAEQGLALANAIAAERQLPLRALRAESPHQVAGVVEGYCDGRLDLVLIDGLHSAEQQALDYDAVRPWLTADAVVLFHDVVNWRLEEGFQAIAARDQRDAAVLHRTASGMAILYPRHAPCARLVEAFRGHPPSPLPSPQVPAWEQRYEGLSRGYLWRGDAATSDKYFALALRESATPARLWLTRAWLYFDRLDWPSCRAALAECVRLAPATAEPRHWQAVVARVSGETPERVWALHREALERTGLTTEMRVDAGFAALAAGDIAAADDLAQQACAALPGWSLPWHLRAICARRLEPGSQAVDQFLRTAAAGAPMTAELAFDAASVALEHGRGAEARRHVLVALDLRPDWRDARQLADRLSALEQPEAAP